MGAVLVILLIVLLAASAPAYPYSRGWGYRPAGVVTALLVILLILLILQAIPWGFPPYSPVVVPR
jgi:hypothetical protein